MDDNTIGTSKEVINYQSNLTKKELSEAEELTRDMMKIFTHNKNVLEKANMLLNMREIDKAKFLGNLMHLINISNGKVDEYGIPEHIKNSMYKLDTLSNDNHKKLLFWSFYNTLNQKYKMTPSESKKYALRWVRDFPKEIIAWKKQKGSEFQKYIREMEKISKSSKLKGKGGRKLGSSKTEQRNTEIRKKVERLHSNGLTLRKAYDIIVEEYPELDSWTSVRDICNYKNYKVK